MPRMATWGGVRIGVSNRAPREPVLVTVKVAPDSSSGVIRCPPAAGGEVGDAPCEMSDAEGARVVDHGDHQAPLGVHRDADVLGVVVGDGARLHVDARVEDGVVLERVHGSLHEERHRGQLDALPGGERVLDPGPQPHEGRDVHLDDRGELGRVLQRPDHVLGDDLAHPAQLDGPALR
ncbi:hypothetical protein GCM10020295_04520 [Streptomyces cinereospinus]